MLVGGSGRCCHIISRIIPKPDGSIANDLSFYHGRRRTSPTYYYHVSLVTSSSTMQCPGRNPRGGSMVWSPIVHCVVRCLTAACNSTDTRRLCTVPSLGAAGSSVTRASWTSAKWITRGNFLGVNPTDTQVCKEGRKGLLKCCQTFSEEPPTAQVEAQRTRTFNVATATRTFPQRIYWGRISRGCTKHFPHYQSVVLNMLRRVRPRTWGRGSKNKHIFVSTFCGKAF